MFCPKCRFEYNPGIFVCPDCDENLVEVLPEEVPAETDDFDDWIQLARLTSSMSAQMIEDVLRSRNIPVVILSETGHFGQTGQMGASSYRPIDGAFYAVMVPAEHAEAADAEGFAILGDEWVKSKPDSN